jgi:hypothetical protein
LKLGRNVGILIEVVSFGTPDFVMIAGRILENIRIEVSMAEIKARKNG